MLLKGWINIFPGELHSRSMMEFILKFMKTANLSSLHPCRPPA